MDKFFKLRENKTTVRTEILAGLTTFLSMAYVLFVNPSMLATTGMELKAVFYGNDSSFCCRITCNGANR